MIPDGIYFAETEHERHDIEKLRFQRLVRDRRLHFPSSLYREERLPIPGDQVAKQIYVLSGQKIAAASRVCHEGLGGFTPLQMEIFQLPSASKELATQDVVIVAQMPEESRRELIVRMTRFALQYIAQLQLTRLLTVCRESELDFYNALGFRAYTGNHFSLERGLLIPLELQLRDILHLQYLASPLMGAYHLPSPQAL